jgi:ATP-binding cassette subfamily F protein 3
MLLQAQQITKSYGGDEVLKDLNLQINEQDRIGLVGANGAGKTTLLQILTGQLSADSGQVTQAKQKTCAYLAQSMEITSDRTIWEEVQSAFAELVAMEQQLRQLEQQMSEQPTKKVLNRYAHLEAEFSRLGGYQYEAEMKSALHGLGLGHLDWQQTPLSQLSGGQKTRTALARTVLEQPDLLILDEPTNYLDLDAILWLEQRLAQYEKALLIVSHDRYFLDRVVQTIWELERGHLTVFTGNYSAYTKQKAEQIKRQEQLYQKQQREIRRTEEFIQKNMARASTTKRAQSRQKALAKMERIEAPVSNQRQAAIRFSTRRCSGRLVVKAEQLQCGYTEPLSPPLSFQIERGDRIALMGSNGVGKSTLLATLSGRLAPLGGQFSLGHHVDLDLYDQEQQDLDPTQTLLEEIWSEHTELEERQVRSLLGQFLFTQEEVYKRVADLSGGEKARLSLLKRLLNQANFLLLDEPTNHLDLQSKEQLEHALSSYEGTLLFVSHDRYFIQRMATQIWELSSQGLAIYPGNYTWYQEKKAQQAAQEKTERAKKVKPQRISKSIPNKKQVQELENKIAQLEQEIAEIEEALLAPNLYQDYKRMIELEEQLANKKQALETALEEWVSLDE